MTTMSAPGLASATQRGIFLVACSAIIWSFGGAIARAVENPDPWVTVFWRSTSATLFILGWILARDGGRSAIRQFRGLGLAGFAVAICLAGASSSFILALGHTSVANVQLIGATVPLIAALMAWLLFGETVRPATWAAIAAVFAGVAIMVSGTIAGRVSLLGDGLAFLIALFFSGVTVITRRNAHVSMAPAVCAGTVIAALVAAVFAGSLWTSPRDFVLLLAFGSLNLGLGLAVFTMGARLIPAAVAALVGMLEPALGPFWVWLVHGETPGPRTLIGGAVIFAALVGHILYEGRLLARRGGAAS
jgi:drug/metabolite transporter (DMT)-like permease